MQQIGDSSFHLGVSGPSPCQMVRTPSIFVASDIHEQQWRLKVSVRNEGMYAKPWLKGEWGDYVRQKQLRRGDRVILTMNGEENGERIYRISAERKHFGFWYSIDDQQ
ncbi:hypothetical protein OIU84_002195 [Salix udensis]|uniref:TF-B3 domain-containing protein n=1 Tax=Salix udensis TaxID=889485 RepID=A0AAD6K3R2_9ROSI|nr:hypothetical protein OIU84_002195 [Salix udensis]